MKTSDLVGRYVQANSFQQARARAAQSTEAICYVPAPAGLEESGDETARTSARNTAEVCYVP